MTADQEAAMSAQIAATACTAIASAFAALTPCVGDVVILLEADRLGQSHRDAQVHPSAWMGTNGTREHPAIVTRVHEGGRLNLHVLFDGTESEPMIGVWPARQGERATDRNLWRRR